MANKTRHVQTMAQLFRVLGDKTRLRILMVLQQGELNVTGLCKKLGLSQPTVSHHLGILRMHRLVTPRRSGKEIHYSIDQERSATLAQAARSLTGRSAAVRIGPILLGLAKN